MQEYEELVISSSDEDEAGCELSDLSNVDSQSSADTEMDKVFNYLLILVNPEKMSDFKTITVGKSGTFSSVDKLKKFKLPKSPGIPKASEISSAEFGYLEPGHGAKGRKVWILKDDDVAVMNDVHSGKKCIRLWSYTHSHKTTASITKWLDQSIHSTLEKLSEVDEICSKLSEKHTGKYNKDQLGLI